MTVEPLYCSELTGRHDGRRLAALAAAFGRPQMEWQHRLSALLTQRRPDGRRHGTVVVSVQRQAGKSATMRDLILDRCLFHGPSQRVWYTAQSGKYARAFWIDCVTEWAAEGSPLAGAIAAKWSQGSEVVRFPNGSTFSPFPPKHDALHSQQSDLVIVDEAWRHDDDAGAALQQAIIPTQATRPDPQTIIVSAAGTAQSTWFRAHIERGRAGLLPLIEYGIGDDGDPTDLDLVVSRHPAVGHTITEEWLREQAVVLADKPGEFARAFGNSWTRLLTPTIPAELWRAGATTDPIPEGELVLAAAVAQDNSRAAIVAAGAGVLEVVAARPGSDWLAPALAALSEASGTAAVGMLRTGPDAPVVDELHRAGVEVATLTTAEYATACEAWFRRLQTGAVRYRHHPLLDAAAADAVRQNIGDGWVWGRRASAGPIPELIAATLADWFDLHRPEPMPAPLIYHAG